MKIWGLIALMIIFSLCISESPSETTPTVTTPALTTPHVTTPSPTTPAPTTPAQVNEELEWGKENGLSEDAISYMEKYDSNTKISPFEQIIGKTFDELYKERNIPADTVDNVLDIVKDNGEPGIEYLREIADTTLFEKMIEDNLIENHEKN